MFVLPGGEQVVPTAGVVFHALALVARRRDTSYIGVELKLFCARPPARRRTSSPLTTLLRVCSPRLLAWSTTTSHIREAMIKVMTHPSVQHPYHPSGTPHGAPWDRGQFNAVTNGGSSGGCGLDDQGNQYPMDPSICTFWCAVALGALVKGSPIEAVRRSLYMYGV